MDICGEHGFGNDDTIAFIGSTCPACKQIEELQNEHGQEVEKLQGEIQDLQAELDESREQ